MDIRLAGSGPAAEAVEAALGDVGGEFGQAIAPTPTDPEEIGGADLAVVVGRGDRLEAASRNALGTETTWIGVENGGIGGHAVEGVEASVAGFHPGSGCFDCLRSRVAANGPETVDREENASVPGERFAGAVAGREALRLLAGDPSPLVAATPDGTRVGGVVELPGQERTFLPVPGCDCDPGSDRELRLDHVDRTVEEALDRAELALDDRVGVVSSVGEAESFPAPYYVATVADTSGFSDARAAEHAAGVDHDWNAAFMKALGEGLERYGAGVYRTDTARSATPEEVDPAFGPGAFVRPDDAPEVDPDESLHWLRARQLDADREVFVPAETVWFPPPGDRHLPAVTTGLGLGSSDVEAVLSGLYEVVERDATMIAWYSTFEPLELAVEDPDYRSLAGRARSEGLTATALLCTVDVDVPVVAAAVHREGEWPRFAAGSAADLDPEAAATDALAEALQNWMELRGMGREDAADEAAAIGRYADFPDPVQEFLDAGNAIPAASVGPDDPPAGEAELDAVVDRASDAGLSPCVASLTPRDVDAIGFRTVRVVVPEAQPLFLDVDRPAFGERARTVPGELGYEPTLERDPHPFP